MATPELTTQPKATPAGVPPLEPGDHLDQKTFHARYEAMPEDVFAELIGGVVYMPTPLKASHGSIHARVITWLSLYEAATPGTRVLDNATVILAEDSEPQPDACLLIRPELGGQTRENEDGYLVGPPELIVEVALSSESYDRHSKLRDYERYGVLEYVVVILRDERVEWHVLGRGKYTPLKPDEHGVFRSPFFPGLWLDAAAMFRQSTQRVREVLQQGLASREHTAFARRLVGE